jgi:hypothetical protein
MFMAQNHRSDFTPVYEQVGMFTLMAVAAGTAASARRPAATRCPSAFDDRFARGGYHSLDFFASAFGTGGSVATLGNQILVFLSALAAFEFINRHFFFPPEI